MADRLFARVDKLGDLVLRGVIYERGLTVVETEEHMLFHVSNPDKLFTFSSPSPANFWVTRAAQSEFEDASEEDASPEVPEAQKHWSQRRAQGSSSSYRSVSDIPEPIRKRYLIQPGLLQAVDRAGCAALGEEIASTEYAEKQFVKHRHSSREFLRALAVKGMEQADKTVPGVLNDL